MAIAANGDNVYVGTSKGLAISPDNGLSWKFIDPLFVSNVAVTSIVAENNVLYMVVTDVNISGHLSFVLLMSPDNGRTWSLLGKSLSGSIGNLVYNKTQNRLYFIGPFFGGENTSPFVGHIDLG